MKKKESIIVLIIAIVLIGIIIFAMTKKKETPNTGNKVVQNNTQANEEFANVLSDGTKVNTSSKLKETKVVNGLEVSDIKLVESGNLSQITATVKNPSSETKGDFAVRLTILDKNGSTLIELGGYIDSVKAGETTKLNVMGTTDFANAYDFKIVQK